MRATYSQKNRPMGVIAVVAALTTVIFCLPARGRRLVGLRVDDAYVNEDVAIRSNESASYPIGIYLFSCKQLARPQMAYLPIITRGYDSEKPA
jgi:hypothetical protein